MQCTLKGEEGRFPCGRVGQSLPRHANITSISQQICSVLTMSSVMLYFWMSNEKQIQTNSPTLTLSPFWVTYCLVPNEVSSEGERHDQDGGGSWPQQDSSPIHRRAHMDVQQHPIGKRHNQQQACEVGHLPVWTERTCFRIWSTQPMHIHSYSESTSRPNWHFD